jgi:hypothetical protein
LSDVLFSQVTLRWADLHVNEQQSPVDNAPIVGSDTLPVAVEKTIFTPCFCALFCPAVFRNRAVAARDV